MVCYSQFKQPTKYKYNVNATDTILMKDILNSVDWEATLEPFNMISVWLFFKSVFQDAIEKCVPLFKPKMKNLYMT